MTQIIPAIIADDENPENDFEELKSKFEKLQPFLGEFDNWVQIDITDGKFVPTETVVNLGDLKYFTEKANVEFHLMINRPEAMIGEWVRFGPKRVIVHIEVIENFNELLNVCRENNIELGLALNPETPNIMIEPWLSAIDLVLFLGVNPGKGGQEFIPEVLNKIKSLRQNFPDVKIGVDGGVRAENIAGLKDAGVNIFVVGSGILKSLDIKKTISELKEK